MTTAVGITVLDASHPLSRALPAYLGEVAAALGVGLESCTIDNDSPVSAYLAVDWKLGRFPDRDVAVLWHEVHGWSLAIETHSGEDLIVLAYLGGDTVFATPAAVLDFATAIRTEDHTLGRPDPPMLRHPGSHQQLAEDLQREGRPWPPEGRWMD